MDHCHQAAEEGAELALIVVYMYHTLPVSPLPSPLPSPRQIMDLETKLSEVQKEVVEGGATRKSRLATDWIPRPPERFELTGHRAPVTKVVFHPTYRCVCVYLQVCVCVCVPTGVRALR